MSIERVSLNYPLRDVAFVADVHVSNGASFGGLTLAYDADGSNARLHGACAALRVAASHNVQAVFVLGDLFDSATPSPAELKHVARTLFELRNEMRVDVVLLRGNHDGPQQRSALEVFAECGLATVIDATTLCMFTCGASLLAVPFVRPAPDAAMHSVWRTEVERAHIDMKPRGEADALAMIAAHVGLIMPNESVAYGDSSGVKVADIASLLGVRFKSLRGVLCGDWHTHSVSVLCGIEFARVGALVPTGFNNVGGDTAYGSVIKYADTGRDTAQFRAVFKRTIVSGPRFFNADTANEVDLIADSYGKRANIAARTDEAFARAQERDVPVKRAVRATNAPVVSVRASIDTLAGAVRKFIDAMPLPDGVSRDDVRAAVRDAMEPSP